MTKNSARKAASDHGESERPTSIYADLLRYFGQENSYFRCPRFLKKANEKRFAKAASLKILRLHSLETMANRDISGQKLYENVAARYLNISNMEAHEIVKIAKESYAIWPQERELKLRDIARYIIITEYIKKYRIHGGVGYHFKEVVHETIDSNL